MTDFKRMIMDMHKAAIAAAIDRRVRNFERNYVKQGTRAAKRKATLGGGLHQVQINVKAWWKQGKYNGEKLRQIRNEQTARAVQGFTHYTDGTPIIHDRLIDLTAVQS